jgi:hypothetical protein
MKSAILIVALILVSCGKQEPQEQKAQEPKPAAVDAGPAIEEMISKLYSGMERAYNVGGIDTDSLLNANFEADVLYVTPWGWTEPLDSTKARLRNAFGHVRDYSHRMESLRVKVFGDAAYAFFILRQQYTVDGGQLDEYLPTTFVLERRGEKWKIIHAHRSTDYETIQQYVALQRQRAAKKK